MRAGTPGLPGLRPHASQLTDGVLDTGGAPRPAPTPSPRASPPEALAALVGLERAGRLPGAGGQRRRRPWREVAERNPGVGLVAVNPPAEVVDEPGISVLRGGRLPLKSRSMRGVVLGSPFGGDPRWVGEAARVVLPGLRVVGEGPDPDPEPVELMASAGGVWVGTRAADRRVRQPSCGSA